MYRQNINAQQYTVIMTPCRTLVGASWSNFPLVGDLGCCSTTKNNHRPNRGEFDTHIVSQSCEIVGCLLGEVSHLTALATSWPTGSYSWSLASVMVKLAENTVYSLHWHLSDIQNNYKYSCPKTAWYTEAICGFTAIICQFTTSGLAQPLGQR